MSENTEQQKQKIMKLVGDFAKLCKANEERIVEEDLQPNQIINLYREQKEFQDCHFWMKGILTNRWPVEQKKVITKPNGPFLGPKIGN